MNGINNVAPGKGYEILPTFLANQSGNITSVDETGSTFDNDPIDGELSLNGKFRISSNATVDGAINPDFSQIESDASQVDVNTTIALFYPERRPFFQEGADIFRTLFNSFYTRTVNDPQYAVKLTGRFTDVTLGFITALDQNSPYMIPLEEHSLLINTDQSYVNGLRGTKQLGQSSSLGFIVTDRRWEKDGSGTILAFDHRIRITRNISFNGQYIWSHTAERTDDAQTEKLRAQVNAFGIDSTFNSGKHTIWFDGESYWGNAFISQIRYNSRSFYFGVGLDQVNPSYRTETGYDPVNNDRNLNTWVGYTYRPAATIFERITPQFSAYKRFNYDGTKKIENFDLSLNTNLRKAQTFIGIDYNSGFERFDNTDFDDLWSLNLNWQSRFNDKVVAGLTYGKAVGYDRWSKRKSNDISIDYFMDLKPIDRLTIEPNITYYTADDKQTGLELYDGFITRTRVQFQANKELSLRLVVEYNDFRESWNIDPLLTYRISSFSVFYVGTSYQYDNYLVNQADNIKRYELSTRQFFMKLQYLFQI